MWKNEHNLEDIIMLYGIPIKNWRYQ